MLYISDVSCIRSGLSSSIIFSCDESHNAAEPLRLEFRDTGQIAHSCDDGYCHLISPEPLAVGATTAIRIKRGVFGLMEMFVNGAKVHEYQCAVTDVATGNQPGRLVRIGSRFAPGSLTPAADSTPEKRDTTFQPFQGTITDAALTVWQAPSMEWTLTTPADTESWIVNFVDAAGSSLFLLKIYGPPLVI